MRVKNAHGLHTRPATVIAKLLQTAQSSVAFTYGEETINAKSIMGILMLAAAKNALVTITVEGDDAQETMRCIVEAFENEFGE